MINLLGVRNGFYYHASRNQNEISCFRKFSPKLFWDILSFEQKLSFEALKVSNLISVYSTSHVAPSKILIKSLVWRLRLPCNCETNPTQLRWSMQFEKFLNFHSVLNRNHLAGTQCFQIVPIRGIVFVIINCCSCVSRRYLRISTWSDAVDCKLYHYCRSLSSRLLNFCITYFIPYPQI